MLRWLALALLLANLVYWAYSHGWLAPIGMVPATERDLTRWEQQVRPDSVRVLPPAAAAAALQAARGAAAAPVLTCLESDAIAAASIDAAEQALAAALPERGWIRDSRELPGQYAVMVGPLANREALQKKAEELKQLRVAFEETRVPGERDGGPGFSLSTHESSGAAQTALESYNRLGVRNARVVPLREASTELHLRFENATPEQAEALRGVKAPSLGVRGMQPCAAPPAARS